MIYLPNLERRIAEGFSFFKYKRITSVSQTLGYFGEPLWLSGKMVKMR
jgi:hypothetical protein